MKVDLIDALHRALTQTSQRTAITATNLANADTPGYRARDVTFPQVTSTRIEPVATEPGHIGGGRPEPAWVREVPTRSSRLDGNTVDVDVEMTRLAAMQGRFSAITQMVRKRFALLRYAATDGRQ